MSVQEVTHSQFKRAVPNGPALLVSLQFLQKAQRFVRRKIGDAGWSSPVARQAHNLKVVGSNPTPATTIAIIKRPQRCWAFFCVRGVCALPAFFNVVVFARVAIFANWPGDRARAKLKLHIL